MASKKDRSIFLWSDLQLFLRFASLTLWLQSEYWLNNLVYDFILWTWPAIKNHKTSLVSKSLVITKSSAVKIPPSCQWRWTTWFTSVKKYVSYDVHSKFQFLHRLRLGIIDELFMTNIIFRLSVKTSKQVSWISRIVKFCRFLRNFYPKKKLITTWVRP